MIKYLRSYKKNNEQANDSLITQQIYEKILLLKEYATNSCYFYKNAPLKKSEPVKT